MHRKVHIAMEGEGEIREEKGRREARRVEKETKIKWKRRERREEEEEERIT